MLSVFVQNNISLKVFKTTLILERNQTCFVNIPKIEFVDNSRFMNIPIVWFILSPAWFIESGFVELCTLLGGPDSSGFQWLNGWLQNNARRNIFIYKSNIFFLSFLNYIIYNKLNVIRSVVGSTWTS